MMGAVVFGSDRERSRMEERRREKISGENRKKPNSGVARSHRLLSGQQQNSLLNRHSSVNKKGEQREKRQKESEKVRESDAQRRKEIHQ